MDGILELQEQILGHVHGWTAENRSYFRLLWRSYSKNARLNGFRR